LVSFDPEPEATVWRGSTLRLRLRVNRKGRQQAANTEVPMPLRSTIVIPARLASTRLPRKLLLAETGKPLIQHTYEAASRARQPAGVVVAADCEEIASAVRGFGGRVELTSPNCASGTDRVAEIAQAPGSRCAGQRAGG